MGAPRPRAPRPVPGVDPLDDNEPFACASDAAVGAVSELAGLDLGLLV